MTTRTSWMCVCMVQTSGVRFEDVLSYKVVFPGALLGRALGDCPGDLLPRKLHRLCRVFPLGRYTQARCRESAL